MKETDSGVRNDQLNIAMKEVWDKRKTDFDGIMSVLNTYASSVDSSPYKDAVQDALTKQSNTGDHNRSVKSLYEKLIIALWRRDLTNVPSDFGKSTEDFGLIFPRKKFDGQLVTDPHLDSALNFLQYVEEFETGRFTPEFAICDVNEFADEVLLKLSLDKFFEPAMPFIKLWEKQKDTVSDKTRLLSLLSTLLQSSTWILPAYLYVEAVTYCFRPIISKELICQAAIVSAIQSAKSDETLPGLVKEIYRQLKLRLGDVDFAHDTTPELNIVLNTVSLKTGLTVNLAMQLDPDMFVFWQNRHKLYQNKLTSQEDYNQLVSKLRVLRAYYSGQFIYNIGSPEDWLDKKVQQHFENYFESSLMISELILDKLEDLYKDEEDPETAIARHFDNQNRDCDSGYEYNLIFSLFHAYLNCCNLTSFHKSPPHESDTVSKPGIEQNRIRREHISKCNPLLYKRLVTPFFDGKSQQSEWRHKYNAFCERLSRYPISDDRYKSAYSKHTHEENGPSVFAVIPT